ncbi:uncharacterized protein LOC141686788 [Apium graveolens]|uniref:uncharacterized protein LOC141686788 n=1 Tax=Apium graveolens TaxID=4045 RepID=UPI003D78CEED
MYNANLNVLKCVINGPGNYVPHDEANKGYDLLTSYNFAFILHLMKEVMKIMDDLCQSLQQKSQDIVNAMSLVYTTKSLLQVLRDEACDTLFENVKSFCEKYVIEIPIMNDRYKAGRGRARDLVTLGITFG